MYKISVPVICTAIERQGREKIVKKLKELDAERVALSIGAYEPDPEKRKALMECLKKETEYFHSLGYEVASWCWTFMLNFEHPYTKMYSVTEQENPLPNTACPLDDGFRAYAGEYISDIAKCGVDLIQFDDDFRYSSLHGGAVACLCPNHRRRICELVGEDLDHATLARRILTGGKNKYRDAWIAVNGESFRTFARDMRRAVDAVNPKIRMGACACLSSWDLDGISADELALELAGDTKPFVRLIGASYWAARGAWAHRMGDVIEQERMERVWTRKCDIEIFAEGDSYPRPRIICPAAYVEGLDTAMRADGGLDGMLKYAIDYTSSGDYENGYVKFHLRNKPTYEGIDRLFSNKTAVGVRVYEYPQKVANMDLGDTPAENRELYYSFFSGAARAFAQTSIPTTYEGEGVVGACFGDSAWSLTTEDCKRGMILDGSAAKILHSRGFDVGIRTSAKETQAGVGERFLVDDEQVNPQNILVYDNAFSKEIRVLSYTKLKEREVPASYLYENADGLRFLVLNFDGRVISNGRSSMVLRHYARARQYRDNVEWLSRGGMLPAYTYGNPDLYMMTKKDAEGNMAVGLWNFCEDIAMDPVIELDGVYSSVTALNCTATLRDGRVELSDIPAFGFVAFEVKK